MLRNEQRGHGQNLAGFQTGVTPPQRGEEQSNLPPCDAAAQTALQKGSTERQACI